MARITVVVAALLAVTTTGFAQNQAAIDRALMVAPNRAKADAGVVSWDASGSRVVLKESSNRMVCYDRSDNAGTPPSPSSAPTRATSTASSRPSRRMRTAVIGPPGRSSWMPWRPTEPGSPRCSVRSGTR